jgi:hypothetical protein
LREWLSTGQHWAQWLLYIEKRGKYYIHFLSLFSQTLPLCSLAVMLEHIAMNATISSHITLHLYTFANLLLCILDGRVQYSYQLLYKKISSISVHVSHSIRRYWNKNWTVYFLYYFQLDTQSYKWCMA